MQGKKNIIDDILSSAKKSAEVMIADAEEERTQAEKAVAALLDASQKEAEEQAAQEAENVRRGKLKLGELEAGKILLRYKRACVDEVYKAVKDKILKMKDADYLDLLGKLIGEAAADGDEIVAAKSDSKRVTAAWVKKLSSSTKKKLALSDEKGEFEGGVVLKSHGYDVDLTIDEIITDLKYRTETTTVKDLGL